jgi:hypothetical protein
MARLAQLRLKERWADWGKNQFTAKSGKHISVYEHMNIKEMMKTKNERT